MCDVTQIIKLSLRERLYCYNYLQDIFESFRLHDKCIHQIKYQKVTLQFVVQHAVLLQGLVRGGGGCGGGGCGGGGGGTEWVGAR